MPVGPQIVGISLVRNEDLYIERVLLNILEFCDRIIVVDHGSTDRTPELLEQLRRQHTKIEVHRVINASVSHDLIAGFAGSPVWIFGIDGDELYEPARLRDLRARVLGESSIDGGPCLGKYCTARRSTWPGERPEDTCHHPAGA